ncbi:hypothetical protein M1O56_04935 [Dehalococcoidia bacterium]|nr:hypothetical protein [Dehalococcoidia bacterium]
MSNNKNYMGAEWVRVDLHLHSPGVESFKLPDGVNLSSKEEKRKIAKEYVNKLKEARIKIGAITDYNGIREEWFDLIKEEAEREGIKIFPGAELDILFAGGKYGLHLLVIFRDEDDISGINRFIHSLDKNPQDTLFPDRTHRSLESRHELESLINEIRNKYDCLIIFPHPEQDKNGLFKTYNPSQSAKYLKGIPPDGIEYFSDPTKSKLLSSGEIPSKDIERLATFENSDPKSLNEIGNKKRNGKIRATYLKLSDFSLSAIKLALHDPQVRVKLYEKPQMTHDRIIRIKINGTTFLTSIDLPINPELNTFIGGRGVGKSAILESVRYCLNLPIYQDSDARKKFVYDVVGSGGEIEVEIKRFYGQEKLRCLCRRTMGKEPEIIDLKSSKKLSLNVHQLFGNKSPILIGQKELYYVASDRKFQLSLIDDLIGDEVKRKQKELDEVIERLNENGEQITKLRERLKRKDEYEQELKNIDDEIKIFERLKVVDKLKRWTDVIDNEQRLSKAEEVVKETVEQIKAALEERMDVLQGQKEYLKRAKPEGKEIAEEAVNILSRFETFIGKTLENFKEESQRVISDYEEVKDKWNTYKKKIEQEVSEIRRELGKERLKPERLEELISRKTKLQAIIKEIGKIEKELKDKIDEREKIKEKMKEKRHELFKIRQKEIEKINKMLKDRAKLRIEFEKDMIIFEEELKSLVSGSGIRGTVIENIIKRKDLAVDGLLLSEYIDEGEDKLKKEFEFTDAMAKRFAEYFSQDRIRFKLETIYPQDRITIELKVNEEFKPIEDLSVGQKATALLLLLFAYENRILIFDQPEEDLDNRFIYEDVVKILREFKGKRQLIAATHNANIPVIGDSELIVVLEAAKDNCKVVDKGSADKNSIKQHIKHIMEGGEEAFKLRIEKYGGI